MTLIFAHRGYAAAFPENTMKAFREAEKASADGIELDVQLTKDGEVVVIHDAKVDRTTDGKGYVKNFEYKELKKLNAAYKNESIEMEPIPSLRDVLGWLAENNLICNIEIKSGSAAPGELEEKVIKMVREFKLIDRIIISSFNHYSIVYCFRLAPDIEIAPLLAEGLYMPWVYADSIHAKGFHPHYAAAPNEIIKASLENNISIRPYTVNKESDMRRLFGEGCTALITDDPVKAFKIRKETISSANNNKRP